jgi:arylsulfatase A-like enzyme
MKSIQQTRRQFLKTVGVSSAGLLFATQFHCAKNSTVEKPNIVFIFSDDHAYQAISAYGSKINKTPNIDRIVNEGIRFDQCCVTNSICAPSRAVILTGKHSHLNGILTNRERFDGSQQTFPKLLQSAGYQTAIVGKWHLKTEPTGFNFWEVLPGQGHYYNPDFRTVNGTVRVTGYVTDIIGDKALDWLKNSRDKTKPFMLMMQNKAPHREWSPSPKYLNLYDDVTIPEPETLFDDYEGRGTAAKTQDMTIEITMRMDQDLKVKPDNKESQLFQRIHSRMNDKQREIWDAAYEPKNKKFKEANLSGKELVRWKYQRYIKDYLRCIKSVDDNVGRILDYLDNNGLKNNTVVIYSSDQGFYLGEHGWFDKRFMYEESFKMPLVARWPGKIKPGSTDNHLTTNLDFAETFLDLAGVTPPPDMQGTSLKPLLLDQEPQDWRKYVYYHYYEFPGAHSVRRHEGVYDGRYKLLHFYDLKEWELFDLEQDPQEMKSVLNETNYKDHVVRLKDQLKKLRELYKVPESPPLKGS